MERTMSDSTVSTTARDAVHNFTHYAALVDAGAEVVITRRGKSPLKLVRAEPVTATAKQADLLRLALSFRTLKSYPGKFKRSDAYDE
jgi:antitoxin (DNA-binding transcriptional repressor) of toxin-antitoxin stability system